MRHYIEVDGRKFQVDFGCHHPDIENNTCPTRKGNCSECRWCKAEMSAADALFLIRRDN